MHVKWMHLCEPGWEAALQGELTRVFPQSRHEVVAPGWLESHLTPLDVGGTPSVALAAQCLPDVQDVAAASISQWVERLAPAVIELLTRHDGPWRWHLFSHYATDAASGRRRCELIQ